MAKLSIREAVRFYHVSRPTLTKALKTGQISAAKDGKGHWSIDPAELARLYTPRGAADAPDAAKPGQLTGQADAEREALAQRVAELEAALDREREARALTERHLSDLRALLPAPSPPKRRPWAWLTGG